MIRSFAAFLIGLVFSAGCGGGVKYLNEYQKNGTYPILGGEYNEPVATIVIDRNGVFEMGGATGSAFLIDKKKGLFGTAKHVVDDDFDYKIFFCGKVYKGERVLSGVVTDVDFIRIVGNFDPSSFPEPYPLADSVNVGEKAFVRGIHLHPKDIQKGKIIHSIVHDYYDIQNSPQEFVYDDLSARVDNIDQEMSNSSVEGGNKILDNIVQRYITIKTDEEHKVGNTGFAGLSGGPTVNKNGEIIGINSNQLDEEMFIMEANGLHYIPRVTLNIIPVQELRRALANLR